MLQATLRLKHHGCYMESLSDGARVVVIGGDSTRRLAMMYARHPSQIDRFLEAVADHVTEGGVLERTDTTLIVEWTCPTVPMGVVARILAGRATIVWPYVAKEGHEHATLILRDRDHLRELVERLKEVADVHVERVAQLRAPLVDASVPLAHVTSGLTRRQLDALRAAIEAGYYATPRRTTLETLSARFGISRSTFQEHLRKAELAMMETFAREISGHPALLDTAMKQPGRPRRLQLAEAPAFTPRVRAPRLPRHGHDESSDAS